MKMTITALQNFVKTYVDAQRQAGAWVESHDNLYKVLDQVGKQISLSGEFQDRLPELDGDNLELGKTVEEFMLDLSMPIDFVGPSDPEGTGTYAENALKPYLPTAEEVSYSYSLGRKILPTTIPYNSVERGCINSQAAANMVANITEKLENSGSLYRYGLKKALIGNFAKKAIDEGGLDQVIADPVDTATGEAFVLQVKKDVEIARRAGENRSLSKTLIGATPASDLVLLVKEGVMSVIETEVEAGAFHADKVALPCTIKVVEDWGGVAGTENVSAILLDTRGVKLHKDYVATRTQENGFSDYVNIFEHSEYTGFISKHTFIKVYKNA